VLSRMKQSGIQVPVVIVTADVQKTTMAECIRLGARCCLNKPVDPKQLLFAVKQASHAE